MKEPNTIRVFADGGARGNPGDAGIGFVIVERTPSAEKILKKCGKYIGAATNNQAEYEAITQALRWLAETGTTNNPLEVYMDSLLVVSQLKGDFKVKSPDLKKRWREVKVLMARFPSVSIKHVKRYDNQHADELVNRALDRKATVEL